MVARVRVTVLDEDDHPLEGGEAAKAAGDWWEFPLTAQGKTILAEAWDLPENLTKFILE